jgi:hypothetical protein
MENRFIRAFIISGVINTIVVLVAAFSRESRLFALPLVFLWPLIISICYGEIRLLLSVSIYYRCFANWKYIATFGILTLVNILLSFKVYVPGFPSADNYFNEYLFILLQLMCLHFLLRHYEHRHPEAAVSGPFILKRQRALQDDIQD